MVRHDESRPRSRRRLVAAGTALVGVLACGIGLTAVAGLPAQIAAVGSPTVPLGSAVPSGSPAAPNGSGSPGASAEPSGQPTPRPSGPTLAELRSIAIQRILQRTLDDSRVRLGIPGVSVTIVFRDGSSWTGTSGLADVAGNASVGADTAFAIGSISKTYTAALILALAADGEIDLDAPALTYVPEAAIDARITIRQLLDHTSGLDDYFLRASIDRALLAEPGAFWSVRRTLKYVGRPYFAPGTGWRYSNTNYLYLGLIAERVTGMTLAEALRGRFIGPLGLDATWYQAVEEPLGPLAHGYRFSGRTLAAKPIDLSDGSGVAPFTSVVSAAAGAGSIAATSADVARWARLLYTGRVLGPAMTAEMLDGVAATAGYRPRVPYGLGVQRLQIGERSTLGHSGRLLGFRSVVRHFPSESLTIAVLTNQSRADPAVIVEDLIAVIFRSEPPCRSCRQAS